MRAMALRAENTRVTVHDSRTGIGDVYSLGTGQDCNTRLQQAHNKNSTAPTASYTDQSSGSAPSTSVQRGNIVFAVISPYKRTQRLVTHRSQDAATISGISEQFRRLIWSLMRSKRYYLNTFFWDIDSFCICQKIIRYHRAAWPATNANNCFQVASATSKTVNVDPRQFLLRLPSLSRSLCRLYQRCTRKWTTRNGDLAMLIVPRQLSNH